MANDPAIPRDRIVYLVVEASVTGQTALRFSLQPPALGEAQAAFRLRGKIMDGSVLDVDLISDVSALDLPAGPKGADATDVQVAAGVLAYLTAHPVTNGQNAMDAQVAAAVAAYIAAHPPAAGKPGATSIGTVTLLDKAALALSAGVRSVAVTAAGLAVGDAVVLTPVAVPPVGYAITAAVVTAVNTLTVTLVAPLLAAGASTSIAVRVFKMNA